MVVNSMRSKKESDHCCEDIDSVFDQYSAPVQLTTAFVTLHGRQNVSATIRLCRPPPGYSSSQISPHVPTEYLQDQSDRI